MNFFRANGKLLISGEYAVLNGSLALAIPCVFGQTLEVVYGNETKNPRLFWEATQLNGEKWLSTSIDLKTLSLIKNSNLEPYRRLVEIFRIINKLNHGFFNNQEKDIYCKTKLEFPKEWGLGSSSTLISLLAQFSGVDAYELNQNIFNTSGYDIACANCDTPILYQLKSGIPTIEKVNFNPSFKDKIRFIYLNRKQDTQVSVSKNYRNFKPEKDWLNGISAISFNLLTTQNLEEFEMLMNLHEEMISSTLGFKKAKELYFYDYEGCIKSLGAWGGDFVMITIRDGFEDYFKSRGFSTILSFDEMVLNSLTIEG